MNQKFVKRYLNIFLVAVGAILLMIFSPLYFVILTPHGYELIVKPLECPKNYVNLSDLSEYPEILNAIELKHVHLNYSRFIEFYKLLNGSDVVVKTDGRYYRISLLFTGAIRRLEHAENCAHVKAEELPVILRRVKFERFDHADVQPLIARNLTEVIELKRFMNEHGNTIEMCGNYYRIYLIEYVISAKEIVCKPRDYIELTDDDLKKLPTLKVALDVAERLGRTCVKDVSKEEFDKILELLNDRLSGYVKYDKRFYQISVNVRG